MVADRRQGNRQAQPDRGPLDRLAVVADQFINVIENGRAGRHRFSVARDPPFHREKMQGRFMVAVLFGQFLQAPQARYVRVTFCVLIIFRRFKLMWRCLNPEILQIDMGGEGGRPQVRDAGEIPL